MKTKTKVALAALALAVTAAAGCQGTSSNNANANDRQISNDILARYQRNQPVSVHEWSQLRQNLNEIEDAQANTTQTTSFFFARGASGAGVSPIAMCPSIGFAIPSTDQVTNPSAKVINHDLVLPQIEPNGVYTGDSSGTYVICTNPANPKQKPYAMYWEGDVLTITGPATFNNQTHMVELTGEPTATFAAKR